VGVVRIKPPPQADGVEYVHAGDSVDGVSSNYLDQADGALLWVGRVEDVATQVANLVSDGRRQIQRINPLDGKNIFLVGVWAERDAVFERAVSDNQGFVSCRDKDGVFDIVLRTRAWTSFRRWHCSRRLLWRVFLLFRVGCWNFFCGWFFYWNLGELASRRWFVDWAGDFPVCIIGDRFCKYWFWVFRVWEVWLAGLKHGIETFRGRGLGFRFGYRLGFGSWIEWWPPAAGAGFFFRYALGHSGQGFSIQQGKLVNF
jgi:hypothetical protein